MERTLAKIRISISSVCLCILILSVCAKGEFTAYNDCVFDPGLSAYGTDPCGNSVHYGDPNHITIFGIGTISTDHQSPPGIGYTSSSGELIDYSTGTGTGVTATLTQSGGVTWQPQVGLDWTGGYDTAEGTDAYNTFGGIVDMTGTIYYAYSAGWYVDVEFTGLDPNKTYTFVTSASRAKDRTDGAPGYTNRISIYTISGIDSAANDSTAGTTEYGGDPLRVSFNTGNNHYEGYVARWTGISPGADGSFKVRAEADPASESGYKAYAFDVFMLTEEPLPPVQATNPTPGDSAANVALTQNLSWTAGAGAMSHDIHFGTINPPPFVQNQLETTYDAGIMIKDTTYYWRIDEKNAGGTTTGTTWSFTTTATTLRIMPLGDSITRGLWGSVYDDGYRKPLYNKLTEANHDFNFVGSLADGNFPDTEHEGHDGWHADHPSTTDDILGQVYNWLTANPADIVLLHAGTNDINYDGEDANEISAILDEIDRFSTDIKVILALIINRREDGGSLRTVTTQYNISLNNVAQDRIAAGDDIVIIDMENALNYSISGGDMADVVHPNDNGYFKMAGLWFNVLDNILPSIYDLNGDGFVNWQDAATMYENWLVYDPNAPGDFYDDDTINFMDFAVFAAEW